MPRTILLQHPLELYCSRLSDDVGKSFDTLLSIADDWDTLRHNTSALVELYNLVYYYACEVYGRTAVKSWLKANQDMSVLDKVNPSDLAFALLVFENYHPKWVAEIKDARVQEGMKQDHQSVDTHFASNDTSIKVAEGPSKKKRKIDGIKLKYTKDGTKKKYLECGWKREGLKRFEHLQNSFAMLLTNEVAWKDCKDGWVSFIEDLKRNSDISCWVPTYYRQDVDDTYDEGNSSDEEEGFEFVLEGSESITSLGELMAATVAGVVVGV